MIGLGSDKNESETTMLSNVSRARSLGKEEKNNGQQPVPALVQLFCPPTSGVAILWTLLTQTQGNIIIYGIALQTYRSTTP